MRQVARASLATSVAVAIAALAAGCSAPSPQPSTPAASEPAAESSAPHSSAELPELSTTAEIVWSSPAEGMTGSPLALGDRVVTYESSGPDALMLSGFDLATGDRAWSIPASTEDFDGGTPFPHVLETADEQPLVVSIAPTYELETADSTVAANDVRVIDPTNGEIVASMDGAWASDLMDCDLEGAICFWNWDDESESNTYTAVTPDLEFQSFDDARGVPADLTSARTLTISTYLAIDDVDGEWLVRSEGAVEQWRVPVEDIGFPSLVDALIQAYEVEDEGLLVLQSTGEETEGESFTLELDAFEIALVDLDTGELFDRHEGRLVCGPALECSGGISARGSSGDGDELELEWTFDDITITSFDALRTNTEAWSATYDHVDSLPDGDPDGALLGWDGFQFMDVGETSELLDLHTGQRYVVESSTMFGCYSSRDVRSRDADPWAATDDTFSAYAIAGGCSTDGATTSDPATFTDAMVRGLGGTTWLPESIRERLDEDSDYDDIEFLPVHTEDALVLFRR